MAWQAVHWAFGAVENCPREGGRGQREGGEGRPPRRGLHSSQSSDGNRSYYNKLDCLGLGDNKGVIG